MKPPKKALGFPSIQEIYNKTFTFKKKGTVVSITAEVAHCNYRGDYPFAQRRAFVAPINLDPFSFSLRRRLYIETQCEAMVISVMVKG